MGFKTYYPEMKQNKPEGTQIDAVLSHGGSKYRLTTALDLSGQGIKLYEALTEPNGRKIYYVTERAFRKICEQYKVAGERLLD